MHAQFYKALYLLVYAIFLFYDQLLCMDLMYRFLCCTLTIPMMCDVTVH